MRNLILVAGAALLIGPAMAGTLSASAAQDAPVAYPPAYDTRTYAPPPPAYYPRTPGEEAGARVAQALPHPGEIAEMGYAMDRVLGAVMDLDVGPIADAVDPYRRYDPYAARTLRDMGSRDDPYFEDRMRHNVYGVTAGMGAMMQSFAALAPVLGRSIEDLQRNVDAAIYDHRARSPYYPHDY